jgi:hypothetical protein
MPRKRSRAQGSARSRQTARPPDCARESYRPQTPEGAPPQACARRVEDGFVASLDAIARERLDLLGGERTSREDARLRRPAGEFGDGEKWRA